MDAAEKIALDRQAIVEQLQERAVESYDEQLGWLSEKCESPIETVLGAHLLLARNGYQYANYRDNVAELTGFMGWDCFLICQCPIGEFRVDFAFVQTGPYGPRILVVECDGHEFHERTKEQASRDRARDRWFVTRGHTVIRFTGSEIWRDPAACREQVECVLSGLADEVLEGKRRVRARI